MLKKYIVLLPALLIGTLASARLFANVFAPAMTHDTDARAAVEICLSALPGGDDTVKKEYRFHVDECDTPLADVKARLEAMAGVQRVTLDETKRLFTVTCEEGAFCPYSALATMQEDGLPVDMQSSCPRPDKDADGTAKDGNGSCPYNSDDAVSKDIRLL
jgi:hypothetical protein